MTGPILPEKALRWAIFAGIALLAATPFVITPGTIFPFVVGKALWSRSLIEIVFALWAVLALARPAYRPPRSWLLLLLGAGLAVSLLAAGTGVSLQRSLWSSYERMQGVVDGAHWVALAVVLASMLRSAAAWRTLLGLNAGAGTAMACLVVARHYQLDIPFYGAVPEPYLPRMSGPFGNPLYLAGYMLFNLALAVGFAVRACLPAGVPAAVASAARAPRGRRRHPKAPVRQHPRARPRWVGVLAWACAAAVLFWGLALAGSVGAFAGLFAAAAFAALGYAVLGCGRGRWIARAALAALAVSAVAIGMRVFAPDRSAALRFDHPVADYVASVHLQRPGVQSRLAAWEAGLEGLAARPALGWGPENFIAVFGRFASGYGAVAEPHDQAHGKLVEVAATTGVAGLAAYLALWALAFLVLWRAARGMAARDRALAVFAGAALFGVLAQSQFLFDTAVGSLQTMLLLGFVVSLEGAAVPDGRRPRLPARLARARPWQALRALLRGGRARLVPGGAAIALAAGGLAANQAIWSAADVDHVPRRDWEWRGMAGGIDGFPALANTWRWWMFNQIGHRWPEIRAADGARARDLLEWAGREAAEAVRTEPGEWRIQGSLARMYRAAAATDPEYGAQAERHLARARALAPNRAVFPGVLEPPHGLGVRDARGRRPRAAVAVVRWRGLHCRVGVAGRRSAARYFPRLRSHPDVVRPARAEEPRQLAVSHQGVPVSRGLQHRGHVAPDRAAGGGRGPGLDAVSGPAAERRARAAPGAGAAALPAPDAPARIALPVPVPGGGMPGAMPVVAPGLAERGHAADPAVFRRGVVVGGRVAGNAGTGPWR